MKYWVFILFLLIGLNSFSQDFIDELIKDIGLEKSQCKLDLIVYKALPNSPEEMLVVIPEIVDEGDDFFELNTHILWIDRITNTIKSSYFESSKTNGWYSDALQLHKIIIDTAPYKIAKSIRAFGIKLSFYNDSQPNPYSNETISLFIRTGNSLKKALHNFTVKNYGGEWDMECSGEFLEENSILIISKTKTNNFFDILVKTKNIEIKSFLNPNNECDDIRKTTIKKIRLKYINGVYQNSAK